MKMVMFGGRCNIYIHINDIYIYTYILPFERRTRKFDLRRWGEITDAHADESGERSGGGSEKGGGGSDGNRNESGKGRSC